MSTVGFSGQTARRSQASMLRATYPPRCLVTFLAPIRPPEHYPLYDCAERRVRTVRKPSTVSFLKPVDRFEADLALGVIRVALVILEEVLNHEHTPAP